MVRSFVCAVLVLGASANAGFAQVVLKPKLAENTKSRTTVEVSTEQTLTLAGMPLETKVEQFMITNDAVGSKQSDGKIQSTGSFETMQVEMQLPGGIQLAFDSGNPKTEAAIPQLTPILQMFDAIASSTYETTFSSPGRIDSIVIRGDKYEALDDALKKDFSPERLKHEEEQSLARLPSEPVKKGDTWKRTELSHLGSGQTFEIERTFEYLGTVTSDGRELDRVGIKAESVAYSVEPNPALPLEVKSSDLKVTESEGEFLFDRQAGAIVRTTDSITIKGKMTLVAGGNELPGDLDLTITTKATRD